MENIKERFVSEAIDWVAKLEKNLLLLEVNPTNNLFTEEIFRVLHTLKGSCAMYGFEKLGHLSHLLEDIFDKIQKKHYSLKRI